MTTVRRERWNFHPRPRHAGQLFVWRCTCCMWPRLRLRRTEPIPVGVPPVR
jgi:hypothetical protein